MTPRRKYLSITAAGVVLLAASSLLSGRTVFVWNATASMPPGLYRISTSRALRVGDFVLLRPDRDSARLFAARGYLPLGVPLLKRVGAVAGQTVCEREGHIAIDGELVAEALAADGQGRSLTPWRGCRRLAADEVFVLVPDVAGSLDGRYFGPSPITSVIGRAVPVWIRDRR